MGRPQITGTELCPKCKYMGRFRTKNARSRPGSRYKIRSYFRHNDSSIPEHYVDNFTRPRPRATDERVLKIEKMSRNFQLVEHGIKILLERYSKFPLEKDELKRLGLALDWHCHNITEPQLIIEGIFRGLLEDPDNNVGKLRGELIGNMFSIDNPLLKEVHHLYQKYDRPKRLLRNKIRNQKLKMWEGRKTTDYTGIENPNLSLLPS